MANTQPQANTAAPAIPHALAARWALRQMLAARAARDLELNGLYAQLVNAHVDRHLAQRRRLP